MKGIVLAFALSSGWCWENMQKMSLFSQKEHILFISVVVFSFLPSFCFFLLSIWKEYLKQKATAWIFSMYDYCLLLDSIQSWEIWGSLNFPKWYSCKHTNHTCHKKLFFCKNYFFVKFFIKFSVSFRH